jgi:hypothetical protein
MVFSYVGSEDDSFAAAVQRTVYGRRELRRRYLMLASDGEVERPFFAARSANHLTSEVSP